MRNRKKTSALTVSLHVSVSTCFLLFLSFFFSGFSLSDDDDLRDSDYDERLHVYENLRKSLRPAVFTSKFSPDTDTDNELTDRHCKARYGSVR